MDFSYGQIALTALIVCVAFVVRGMSGFGSSLVAMPLLALIMPIHTAVPLMGLLAFVLICCLLTATVVVAAVATAGAAWRTPV